MAEKGGTFPLALSAAGRDKGRLYAVLERNEKSVLLADGKRRKLSSPKRKNIKHVILLSEDGLGPNAAPETDAALRRLLAAERNRRQNDDKSEKDQGGTKIG